MIVLETRNLTVRFGGVTAVNGVDFQLQQGEVRCLIGPNGAGKSTFFSCLCGVRRPDFGDIWLNGERVNDAQPHHISQKGVGVKTQVPSLMNDLTVREHIWLAARRVCDKHRVSETIGENLQMFGIQAIAKQKVSQLSHGQRQIVELATVFAGKPHLILLDEPAAGMSEEERDSLVSIIGMIAENASMIVVDHDMSFIRRIADYITVFNQGEILLEGDTETVMNNDTVRQIYLGRSA